MPTSAADVSYRERMVVAADASLRVGEFGGPGPPSFLLIGGMGASMDWWPDDLCRRLAERGAHVVRYDHRDTGGSTAYPVGRPGYTSADLVHDPLAVLGGIGVEHAHVVGISMGGAIAQHLGLEHAERVASLTLISTTAAGPGGPSGLPPMRDDLREWFESAVPPDWDDTEAVIDAMVASERAYGGPSYFDEAETRLLAAHVVQRSTSIAASLTNHGLLDGEVPGEHELGSIAVPTSVIHGTEDPLFPVEHGEALARSIPGARLLLLDAVGHQVPPRPTWPTVLAAIAEQSSIDITPAE